MSDIEFSPNQINIENLSELTRLHTLLSEKRICELHEISVGAALLIKEMLNSGFGIYEALSLISQGFFEKLECEHDNLQKEKLDMLASYVKAFSVYDKSCFSSLLLSKLSSLGVSVSEELFFDKEEREESIAFVKSLSKRYLLAFIPNEDTSK